MKIGILAVVLSVGVRTGEAQQEAAAIGDPLFPPRAVSGVRELRALDGPFHLDRLRGSVTVFEWTNHVCPAVERLYASRAVADARAAAQADGAAWVQVDSSWFAGRLSDDIERWRERQGCTGPYILDEGGRIAQRFGAVATPQFFVVDAHGRLAYAGGLHHGEDEAARRNHVLEAVTALVEGNEVAVSRTRAAGCSLKLVDTRRRAGTFERRDIDEDAQARAHYSAAARAAAAGEFDRALRLYETSLDAGLAWPWWIVADDAFVELIQQAQPRARLRQLLRARPARGQLTMVTPGEPGDPFVLTGTVRQEDGEPIAGAELALYHTDAAGWYSPGSTESENPRLFAFVETDERGRYRVRTVFPGRYADAPDGPAHIHMAVRAAGFRMQSGHRASVFFEDDPALRGAALTEIRGDGCAIVGRGRNAEGVLFSVHDITLEPE